MARAFLFARITRALKSGTEHAIAFWRPLLRLELLALLASAIAAYGAIAAIQQMRLERRAWISIEEPSFLAELNANDVVDYRFVIHNTGPSPATITRFDRRFVSAGDPLTMNLDQEFSQLVATEKWGSVIAPNAKVTYPGKGRFDVGFLAPILDGKFNLLLIGEIEYRDGLDHWWGRGPIRKTRFCLSYDLKSKELRFCVKYNDMD